MLLRVKFLWIHTNFLWFIIISVSNGFAFKNFVPHCSITVLLTMKAMVINWEESFCWRMHFQTFLR